MRTSTANQSVVQKIVHEKCSFENKNPLKRLTTRFDDNYESSNESVAAANVARGPPEQAGDIESRWWGGSTHHNIYVQTYIYYTTIIIIIILPNRLRVS